MMRMLYAEHAAALSRYALRLTGDRARAEDVVQETLLRAWRHPPETTNGQYPSARGWLFTVARNLVIDERRSARYRRETGTADIEGLADSAAADGVGIVGEADSTLDRLLLTMALARLSVPHREVIRRAYYQGWTVAQIAEDQQIAEGTVKSRLHYAVRALRLSLQEMGVTR
jgi:RNA polymerase sigma-70 factor (ECF subfamily)